MDRTQLKHDLFHKILHDSFERPSEFSGRVDEDVVRNRSLHSSERRELSDGLYDAFRWRRRLWGDIAPQTFDYALFQKRIGDARACVVSPPLARWSSLAADALSRELSFPTWLFERWMTEFGFESAVRLALSMNGPAPTALRTNILKTTREKLVEELSRCDVPTKEGLVSPWALALERRTNLRGLNAYKKGWFEIQDEGSQAAVLECDAHPEMTVIDSCCGAGGKTLALAAVMENRGRIVAVDSDARAFDELSSRAKRSGVTIAQTEWVARDDPEPLAKLVDSADRVLVDAPCSALGTIRRSPWLKWSLTPAAVDSYPKKQLPLLFRASRWVKPGGKLVYVTCTLNRRENEEIVEAFSGRAKTFSLSSPPRSLRPDVEGTDGFFIATFDRIG